MDVENVRRVPYASFTRRPQSSVPMDIERTTALRPVLFAEAAPALPRLPSLGRPKGGSLHLLEQARLSAGALVRKPR